MPPPSPGPRLKAPSPLVGFAGLAALAMLTGVAAPARGEVDEGSPKRVKTDALAASVGAYVERFQVEMEAAVLDESYVQLLRQPCCREPRRPGEDPLLAWSDTQVESSRRGLLARRQSKSEILLVKIAGGMRVGYRDVYEVDGQTIQDRSERVRRLFLSGTQESALALGKISAESARFNLGQMQRTTNLPTMPLLYLATAMHPRLFFSRGGDEDLDGVKTTILEFREDGSPTLAASGAGIDMPARGRAWIEPATGRIRRIELRYAAGARRVMTVWFREDPRIGVLAPARMWEWYERIPIGDELPAGDAKRAWPADVEALATYTNLRLFSVDTSEEVGQAAD